MTEGRGKREWRECNENLVRREEILLEVDCLKEWRKELIEMNKGGRPFKYPNSLILFWGH